MIPNPFDDTPSNGVIPGSNMRPELEPSSAWSILADLLMCRWGALSMAIALGIVGGLMMRMAP
jgi:hypothetical protein